MTNRRDLLLNSRLSLVLLLLLLACLNYLSTDSFVRLDLTRDRDYSLSPAADSILQGLESPVAVEVFLSADLPPRFALHTQRIQDKLAELEARSPVPFEVTYVDPGEDEALRERAHELGVVERQTSVRSRGKLEAQMTWLGLALHYQGRSEVLPFIDETATLEYQLSSALRTLQVGDATKVVGIATGQGEPDLAAALAEPRNPLHRVAAVLGETYTLRAVDIAAGGPIPDVIDVMILMGSRSPLGPAARYSLDQFVMGGGALGIFPYGALPDTQTLRIAPAPFDASELTAAWGVRVGRHLLAEPEMNDAIRLPVRVETGRGVIQAQKQVSSPLVPILRDLESNHPITRRLDTLVAPFATTIDSSGAESLPEVTATVLAWSSEQSRAGLTFASLDPRANYALLQQAESGALGAPSAEPGPHAALVAVHGALPSGWAGSPPATQADLPQIDRAPPGTRAVIGSSFELPLANPGLLLSIVDWLAADEILLGIRPRLSTPPLLEIPEQVRLVRLANVAGVPGLVALLGFLRLRRRRLRGRAP